MRDTAPLLDRRIRELSMVSWWRGPAATAVYSVPAGRKLLSDVADACAEELARSDGVLIEFRAVVEARVGFGAEALAAGECAIPLRGVVRCGAVRGKAMTRAGGVPDARSSPPPQK